MQAFTEAGLPASVFQYLHLDHSSTERLASYLELDAVFDAFMQWVLDLRRSIGIPHTLDALIRDAERLDDIGEMAVLDSSSITNPIQHSAEGYAGIARNAFNGVL